MGENVPSPLHVFLRRIGGDGGQPAFRPELECLTWNRCASACRQPANTGDEKSLSFARSDFSRYATYCCFRDSPAAAPDPAYSGWHRSYARDNSIAEPSGLIPAGLCIDDDR